MAIRIMVACIALKGSLVPLIKGLCSSIPYGFEFSVLRLLHGDEEEHGKECLWQLGSLNQSVECEEVWLFIYSLSLLRYFSRRCEVLQ